LGLALAGLDSRIGGEWVLRIEWMIVLAAHPLEKSATGVETQAYIVYLADGSFGVVHYVKMMSPRESHTGEHRR